MNTKSGAFASVTVYDNHAVATIPTTAFYKIDWWKVCGIFISSRPVDGGYEVTLKRLYELDESPIPLSSFIRKMKEAGYLNPKTGVAVTFDSLHHVHALLCQHVSREWADKIVGFAKMYFEAGATVCWDMWVSNWMMDADGYIIPNDPLAIWM
jgi:hypothetical protein